jgi:hypothetical protein
VSPLSEKQRAELKALRREQRERAELEARRAERTHSEFNEQLRKTIRDSAKDISPDRVEWRARVAHVGRRKRTPGRPRDTHEVTCDEIVSRDRQMRAELDRGPKQWELAKKLIISVRTLQDRLAECGLPWPIE